jgi:exosortase E/protease (VPEID-CTERM system)
MSHARVNADVAIPIDDRMILLTGRLRMALRVGVVLLVGVEVIWLTTRVDGIVLLRRTPALYGVIRAALAAWQALAAMVATMALLCMRARGAGPEDVAAGRPHRVWPWLMANALTLTAFVGATDSVFKASSDTPAGPLEIGGWGILGLATVLSGLAIAWPIAGWAALARRNAGRWAFAGVVGLSAYALGRLTIDLWRPLNRATFWLTSSLLHLVSREVVCRPDEALIGTGGFSIKIAPACTGYEGIGLIVVLIGAYLVAFRRDLRMPRALLLLPIGVVTIWVANAVRLVGLISVGTWVSAEVAENGFHSQAGWIAFNAVGLGLVAASRAVPWFRPEDVEPLGSGPSPTVAHLAPLAAVTAMAMVTGAFSGGFDPLYPARLLAAGVVLWACRRQYRDLRATWSWGAVAIGGATALGWIALEAWTNRGVADAVPTGLATLPFGLAAIWMGARLVGYVLMAPVVEELAFRGYLIRRVGSRDFTSASPGRFGALGLVVSSALFGLMHERFVAGTLAGFGYAYALRRRGELSDAIVAHATTNALLAVLVLTTGNWSYWG